MLTECLCQFDFMSAVVFVCVTCCKRCDAESDTEQWQDTA